MRGPFLLHSGFVHVDNVIASQCSKESHGCSCLSLELSEPSLRNLHHLRNLHQHEPKLAGTLRNPPEPSRTFQNLPPKPTPTPELSGTLWRSAELSGTLRNFRNLSPEPAPATRTGTHRSLSGLKTPLAYAVGEKRSKLSMTTIKNDLFISCPGFGSMHTTVHRRRNFAWRSSI